MHEESATTALYNECDGGDGTAAVAPPVSTSAKYD